MGNSQLDLSVSRQKLQYSLEHDLVFVKKLTDDRYGEIKVMEIKDSRPKEFVALKTIMASSLRDCEQILDQVSLRKGLDLPTVVRIKVTDKAEMDQFCSHYFKIYVLYEYFERTLKSEIEKREGKRFPKVHFAEVELYHLIDCVLSALILFNRNNIVHSDIRPYTIFFSEDGVFKLNDIQFMSGLNAYTQFLMGTPDYDHCFLAPELFVQLGHRILQPVSKNQQKSDVFSLGMTVLEAATLRPVYLCYDFDGFVMKENVIVEYLEEVKLRYSENLYNLLKNMVQIDEKLRFDYTQVYQSLSPKQEQPRDSFSLEIPVPVPESKAVSREEKPKKKGIELEISEPKAKEIFVPPLIPKEEQSKKAAARDIQEGKPSKDLILELNLLEEKIKEAMIKSEDAQKNSSNQDYQRVRSELMKDEYLEFLAKREEVVRKSEQARESITMERKKKTVGIIDERDLLDSNKLYEMYLEEYENLKRREYA